MQPKSCHRYLAYVVCACTTASILVHQHIHFVYYICRFKLPDRVISQVLRSDILVISVTTAPRTKEYFFACWHVCLVCSSTFSQPHSLELSGGISRRQDDENMVYGTDILAGIFHLLRCRANQMRRSKNSSKRRMQMLLPALRRRRSPPRNCGYKKVNLLESLQYVELFIAHN
jgi:hypothetical protein